MQICAECFRALRGLAEVGCLVVMLVVATPWAAAAVTVVECRDADGNVSFRDRCPPNVAKTGEKQLLPRGKKLAEKAAEAPPAQPVVLYAAPGCASCDLVRMHLRSRDIPFSERDAGSDPLIQAELKAAAGTLAVPTLTVGAQSVQGYDGPKIESALNAGGYPPETPPATEVEQNTANVVEQP